MAEQWMSIVEYARAFNVSDMTVRRRIKTGRLHAVLQEGKYFIPVSVDGRAQPLAAAIESHEGVSSNSNNTNSSSRLHHVDTTQRLPAGEQRQIQNSVDTRRHSHEMVVIKAHPSAHKTYQEQVSNRPGPVTATYGSPASNGPGISPQRPIHPGHKPSYASANSSEGANRRDSFAVFDESNDASIIPDTLRRSLVTQETSLVDTRALLAFCEASLRKLSEGERRQAEKFKSKLEALEAIVAKKDIEIKQLSQQLEDLQLLVKVLDTKKKPI